MAPTEKTKPARHITARDNLFILSPPFIYLLTWAPSMPTFNPYCYLQSGEDYPTLRDGQRPDIPAWLLMHSQDRHRSTLAKFSASRRAPGLGGGDPPSSKLVTNAPNPHTAGRH